MVSRRCVSRLSLVCGGTALATLLWAFVGGTWLHVREPITLPNSDITTTVSFRIGLWRVCPTLKRPNHTILTMNTIHMPSPACSLVKYSGWEEVRHTDLGIWTPLEFTPSFVDRMRVSTIFAGASVLLMLIATVFALIGHCNSDHKTLIACGLYILGGLSLGSGLVVFATVLSETFIEATAGKRLANGNGSSGNAGASSTTITTLMTSSSSSSSSSGSSSTSPYDYKYGWSFFIAVVAFVLAEITALLSITAYLRRFPTVEDMVREMVPGAERKLREHQRLSSEYLVRHSGPLPTPNKYHHMHHHHNHHHPHHHNHNHHQYDPIPSSGNEPYIPHQNRRPSKSDLQHISAELEACDGGPLLLMGMSKTPPDVCTTTSSASHETPALFGQTVPITIKSGPGKFHASSSSTGPNKYGTLPHQFTGCCSSGGERGPLHSGFLGYPETATASRSQTLQHTKSSGGKKSVTIGTFQTMDANTFPAAAVASAATTSAEPPASKRGIHGYGGGSSGSAV